MDLRVSGTEVLLTLHRSYVANDDTALLQQVAKFKPLADWITNFRADGFTLAQISVRNIQFVAQRILSLSFDAVLVSSKDRQQDATQPVTLVDQPPAVVLLPVVTVNGERFGVLAAQPRLAAAAAVVEEALLGYYTKDGALQYAADLTPDSRFAGLLAAAGIPTAERSCAALSNEEVSLGAEGHAPVRLMTTAKAMTKAEFDAAFGAAQVAASGEDGYLVAHPLKVIASQSTDLKARLAATLALAK